MKPVLLMFATFALSCPSWMAQSDCDGTLDVCGICDGPGAIYECGCQELPEGDCNCIGSQLDALEECGGACLLDEDGDGNCDGSCLTEGYVLETRLIANHLNGDLAGMKTWRLYVKCQHPLDYVSAFAGDAITPLRFTSSSGSWYNNPTSGSWDASGLNPSFFQIFPELIFDSFLTIGSENSFEIHPSSTWGQINPTFEFDGDGPGSNVIVDDATGGAIFIPFASAPAELNPAYAGTDLEVLVAQFTTAGNISGSMQLQIFQEGNQTLEKRFHIFFDSAVGGICTGSCMVDVDMDGICDDFDDCVGQLDACGICNGPGAIYSCGCDEIPAGDCDCGGLQIDAIGVCGGNCLSDSNGNGVCDSDELAGPGICGFGTVWDENTSQCIVTPPNCGVGFVWDPVKNGCVYENPSDINMDGCVDVQDFMFHLSMFGLGCGNEGQFSVWTCGDSLEWQNHLYPTSAIGNQCWLAENVKHLPSVSQVIVGSEDDGQPHAYVYDYDGELVAEAMSQFNHSYYGGLYNFEAVQGWDLCPVGWTIPSNEDWAVLMNNIPVQQIASQDWIGTDEFGFGALPAGDRDGVNGQEAFNNIGVIPHWWTSEGAMIRIVDQMTWDQTNVAPSFGLSVRCIKN